MHIVIATAEPRAAYHLTPLAQALVASPARFSHLVPYPEPTQGDPVVDTVTDASVLSHCDRVVITGGTLSAWTELVARRALSLGTPLIFSELAYVANPAPHPDPITFAALTALSPDGASSLASYFGIGEIQVTGTPALDTLSNWNPVPNRALLLSTADMVRRDPGQELLRLAYRLRAAGWEVRVRPHPREELTPWEGFEIVTGESQTVSASTAGVVVGYPGSAHVLAAALGVPTISLAPTCELAGVFTPAQAAALSGHAATADEALELLVHAAPPDPDLVHHVVGPLGGAAARLVAAWTAPLP